jgi:type I restriction enzyme R subunit
MKYNLCENLIENMAISLLKDLGYSFASGQDISYEGQRPLRTSLTEALLLPILQDSIYRFNPDIPESARQEALSQVQRIYSQDLLASNEAFHIMLTEGVTVSYQQAGSERGDLVWLIDYKNPENNNFLVVNQYTVIQDQHKKRPDIVIFINGLPLVIFELKNPIGEHATLEKAWNQLTTYKDVIPSLLTYNAILIISDGIDARAGTISSDFSRFAPWKSLNGQELAPLNQNLLEVMIKGMLNKITLLDIINHFIVFEKEKRVDASGQISIVPVKKIAAYHQYYAVNKAVDSALKATSLNGNRKVGVIWHTQGSGKSLSMAFFTGKAIQRLDNPTVLALTDRNDLDDQLYDTFASTSQLFRQEPKQANDRQNLKELLKVSGGGVVFSTIQKFQPEDGNVYDELSSRRNILVIADEAHRTQYGFKAKIRDIKDQSGKITDQKFVYGLAKYLRDALPNASFIGFTGTPIEETDINTPAVFGDYIDIYDIAQAVEDGATVPIYYESRLARIDWSKEGRRLVEELDSELDEENLEDTQLAKANRTKLEAIVGSDSRLKMVAKDIVDHFEARCEVLVGKGMIVCMSRVIAVAMYQAITKIKPEWHSDDLAKGQIKVVMTSVSSDGSDLSRHHTTTSQRKALSDRMKNVSDPLKLVIVCDMWLTGFDVPCLHTMYIDKPMKGHTLMQGIARVNRVFGDKPGGLIVDYIGIASSLKDALAQYSRSGGKGDLTNTQEKAVTVLKEKLEVIDAMLYDKQYFDYFSSDTSKKLDIILSVQEHILSIEDGQKRYLDTVAALSSAYALSNTHPEAQAVREKVAFFQAIKVSLVKLGATARDGKRTVREIELAIRQVIDQALVSSPVVDIYDAAGIKKPDISILSDEFLDEIKNMPHKNTAVEVLKHLLAGEIKSRAKINLIQGKSLLAMLDETINKYNNRLLTAAEIIEDLIKLSKCLIQSDKDASALNLSEYEYAFYTAVADNDSACELMKKDKLRELAVVLTEQIKNNATLDWIIKENVRAHLRVVVRRTLRKYGYPPDMEKLATENVIAQAEMLAEDLNQEN